MLNEKQRILEGEEAVKLYEQFKERGLILYECVVGSQAYGTALPTSDEDKKFIYIEPIERILNQTYSIQLNVNKDYVGFEIGRYLQLIKSQNPNLHEILWQDDETVLHELLFFKIMVKSKREELLTKGIGNTFGKYAEEQIKKARGQNKMITQVTAESNPWSDRKTPLDFCYVSDDKQGTILLSKWLENRTLKQEFCGVVNLPHTKEGFSLYYDWIAHAQLIYNSKSHDNSYNDVVYYFINEFCKYHTEWVQDLKVNDNNFYEHEVLEIIIKSNSLKYKGIIKDENSNSLSISSTPKGAKPITTMFYNVDAYQHHCKEYRKVKQWEQNRNEERYQNNLANGAQYDAKNMMHCHRLLDMCIETLETGKVYVKRPNREELLEIRAGKYPFEKLLADADAKIAKIQTLLKTTSLKETLDDFYVHDLLLKIRLKWYNKEFGHYYFNS